jgi:hypothetical protein
MLRFFMTLILILLSIENYCQENLAIVIKDYRPNGGGSMSSMQKGDLIVVYKPYQQTNIWPCWDSTGNWGTIDTSSFRIVADRPIFRIKSNPTILKHEACSDPIKEDFKIMNVDYCNLIDRIIHKDYYAFKEFINLIPKVDAALSETHSADTWTIINLYTDTEFNSCIGLMNEEERSKLVNYLKQESVGCPISRFAEYLELYYPMTWTKLKKYK